MTYWQSLLRADQVFDDQITPMGLTLDKRFPNSKRVNQAIDVNGSFIHPWGFGWLYRHMVTLFMTS